MFKLTLAVKSNPVVSEANCHLDRKQALEGGGLKLKFEQSGRNEASGDLVTWRFQSSPFNIT